MDWRFTSGLWAALVVSAAVVVATPAGADPPTPTRLRLGFEASAGCPTQRDFEARVAGRVPQPRVRGNEFDFQVRVSAPTDSQAAQGELIVHDASGARAVRSIRGATCAEVVDGLALVVALIVESGALPASAEPEPPTPPEAPLPEPPEPSGAARAQPDAAAVSASQNEPARSRTRRRASTELAAALVVASGTVPGVRPGAQVGVTVAIEGSRLPPVALGVRGSLVAPSTLESDQGNARFHWATAALLLCSGPAIGARGRLWFCAVGELGALGASGRDTDAPRSDTRLWSALGPGIAGTVGLARRWTLDVGGEGLFPLVRDRFLIAGETLYTPPVVGARAHVGIGLRF